MRLIIETDIGHDPDDFFTIAYLAAKGVDIVAILVSPGDPDQIAIARLLCEQIGLDIPIGAAKMGRTKLSSGSIHHALLKRYGKPLTAEADDTGEKVIESVMAWDSLNTELFVIGPVSCIGTYLSTRDCVFSRATMQGGFAPYSLHRPVTIHPDFDGKEWMPTFNLNSDRPNAQRFLDAAMPRQMVGKNVCHTVLFDRARYAQFASPINRASELFHEAAQLYFQGHDAKKFHDPTAAVCHFHPEVGTWLKGKTVKREGGWTTTTDGCDSILVDLDHEAMWTHLQNWT